MDDLIKFSLKLAKVPTEKIEAPISNRIAYIVSHGQSYSSNGYAVRTHGIAKALNDNNFETLCFVRPGRPWEFDRNSKIGYEEVVDGIRYIHTKSVNNKSVGSNEYLKETVDSFVELFRIYRPSKVVAASNWIIGLPAWIAAFKLNLPFINEVRGFWELSKEAREPGYQDTEDFKKELIRDIFVAQRAVGLITLNNKMKAELVERGVRKSTINIVPNSVEKLPSRVKEESSVIKFDKKDKVVGYVGSFSKYEGIELLEKACEELIYEGYPIKLVMVGNDVKDKSDKSWLYNIGRVPHHKVSAYFDLMDLVVIPRHESKVTRLVTPIKLVEALSYDKTVLVSSCIPKDEVTNLNNVYEFFSDDLKSLKKMIVTSLHERKISKNRNVPIFNDSINPFLNLLNNAEFTEEEKNSNDEYELSLIAYTYYTSGTMGVLKFLTNKQENDKKDYIAASNYFKKFGLNDIAFDILNSAPSEIKNDTAVLKAIFWIAKKKFDFEKCHKVVNQLALAKKTQTQEIDKLRKSYGCSAFLNLFDNINENSNFLKNKVKGRVCYLLHNSLPYSSGGYATRADGVAQGLKNSNHEVVIITRPGFPIDIKPELKSTELALSENISGINYRRILKPDRKSSSGVDYIKKSAIELEAKFKELRPEVVIAASNHITAIPALLAAKKLGIPFIYEVRGFWEVTRLSREPEYVLTTNYHLMVLYEALTAKHADHVFTLTEPMKEELILRGVESNKITLLPNSCDPTRFTPRKKDLKLAQTLGIPSQVTVIGYIGSFVVYEGLEHLASACSLLKEKGVEFRLLIVGNENTSGNEKGPITQEINDIAEKNGFSDWLIMPGRVPHEEVENYYSLIDIAPFPRKPWPVCEMVSPMKPLEALAMEKAVIVSSVRALVEMVKEDETGLVFNKGSVASLSEQLEILINDPKLRERLGKQGRVWVENERTWLETTKIASNIIGEVCSD